MRPNHTGHNAARMHTDSHVNIQVIALCPNLTDVTNHSQSQIDATFGMMRGRTAAITLWIWFHAGHTIVAVAQEFDPQHIELLRRLIEFNEQLMQHLDQRLHRQLRCDLRIIHNVCIQNTDTRMPFNVQFAEIIISNWVDVCENGLNSDRIYLIACPRHRRFGIGSVRLHCKCS